MDNAQDLLNFLGEGGDYDLDTVDDTVMGGVSDSRLRRTDSGIALFTGEVSLENNGGFSSAQVTLPPTDIDGATEIWLRVRGDGQSYGLNLRSAGMTRLSYRAGFDAPEDWQTLALPLLTFRPVRFGDVVPDAPPLDTTKITMVGFILVGQPGPFHLEIARVWADR